MRYSTPVLVLAFLLTGCARQESADADLVGTRRITMPGGEAVRAEVEIDPTDMQKGMMFRDALPRGHGMLFIHQAPGMNAYWMYQMKIPLDIIWMDSSRHIVEISADTPPCKTKASLCPTYGGHRMSQFVLELGAGEARRMGLTLGQTLEF